jgi:hypothetical protein
MSVPLATNACNEKCDWQPTDAVRDNRTLFVCAGCASEWISTERWTPQQADGTMSAAVTAERQLHPVPPKKPKV